MQGLVRWGFATFTWKYSCNRRRWGTHLHSISDAKYNDKSRSRDVTYGVKWVHIYNKGKGSLVIRDLDLINRDLDLVIRDRDLGLLFLDLRLLFRDDDLLNYIEIMDHGLLNRDLGYILCSLTGSVEIRWIKTPISWYLICLVEIESKNKFKCEPDY